MDATSVTNHDFRRFVEATGHVTLAEIAPDPKGYPGALPRMLKAGSLVFSPPARLVNLNDWSSGGRSRSAPSGEGPMARDPQSRAWTTTLG